MTEPGGDGATTAPRAAEVEAMLGQATLSQLRRHARNRPGAASIDRPAVTKLAPPAARPWLRRSARHPIAVLFLILGAATTGSLAFAASRLNDDGSLSGLDWFRLVVVGIIAAAFFLQLLAFAARLPPIPWIRRRIRATRVAPDAAPLATVPVVDQTELTARADEGFGRLSSTERARVRTQTALDDLFWAGVNVTILALGGFAAYGLGYTAVRDLLNGDNRAWAAIRLVLFVLTMMGLARVFTRSIAQLRMRRQRRRRRAIRRLLRYLLWWDRPASASAAITSTRGTGPVLLALSGLTPFLLCCGIAVSAAAYSPWGDKTTTASADATQFVEETSAAEPTTTTSAPTPAADRAAAPDPAVAVVSESPSVDPTSTTTDSIISTTSTTSNPDSTTTSAVATTTDTTVAPPSATTTEPTATATVTTASATAPPTTTATTTASTSPTTVTPTTLAVSTTTSTTSTTSTSTTTTTTVPTAPLMVINSFNAVFTCNSGTTNFNLSWNVSGDPAGQVDIFRNHIGGSFTQIGFDVSFNGGMADAPPVNGSYQYWLIANNSDFADETSVRDVGSVITSCIS